MHSTLSILVVAGLASSAAAAFDAPGLARHFARQTQSDGGDNGAEATECADKASSIIGSFPTPTGDILSYITQQATMMPTASQSDLCATPSIPSSLTSAYSSYESQLVSWYSSGSSELEGLATSCSNVPGFGQLSELLTMADAATSSCFGQTSSGASASGSQTQSSSVVVTSTFTSETVVPSVSGGSTISVTKPVTGTVTSTSAPAGAPRATAGAAVMAAAGIFGAAVLL